MKQLFRHIYFRRGILLILAALLFIVSIIFNRYFSQKSTISTDKKRLEKYLHSNETSFKAFLADTVLIRKLIQKTESLEEFKKIASSQYGIYLFSKSFFGDYDMLFWSNQLVVPPEESYDLSDGEYFQHLDNGYYLAVKKTIALPGITDSIQVHALIPVRFEYFIESAYMHAQFAYSNDADQRIVIAKHPTDFPVRALSGKVLFHLDKKVVSAVATNDDITIGLRISAIILLLIFIHFFAEAASKAKGVWASVGLLAGLLIVIRLLLYFFPGFLNLRQYELFDPTIYGSNVVQRSLGDLLINSVLFCWLVLFAWSKLGGSKTDYIRIHPWRWVIGIASLFFLILSTFTLATVIRSLIADSKISFDVTNFFSLNIYSVVGFVVLASLSLAYYYFTQLLFHFIFPVFQNRDALIYFVIGFTGLVYLTAGAGAQLIQFYLLVLLWLIIYTWLVSQQGSVINKFRVNIAGILFWIFIFSVSISAIILSENKKNEWQLRKSMADKIATSADPSNEKQISIALAYLDNDFLSSNFPRFKDEYESLHIRDSIITASYKDYINKYDTRLYVYDANGKGLHNLDQISYESFNTILPDQTQSRNMTGFYYETQLYQFTYITRREVTDTSGKKLGSFFIISTPKKYSSDALFPELFRQKQSDPDNSPIYSSAIYDTNRLVSPPNKYPFATSLKADEVPREEFEKRKNGDYNELWYRAGNNKIVVIARKKDSLIETITLFSYIFCAFLFMVALFQLLSLVLRTGYDRREFKKLWQMNIRTQVHSTIIFISILSFTIIGVATISFFISRYNRNNTDKLSRTMRIMVNEMQKKYADQTTFDDVVRAPDSASTDKLQKLIDDVSQIHDVDVNVYTLAGDLRASSEPNVYRKGVLSLKINPEAYYHLSRLRQIRHVQDEQVAKLSYQSMYAPVRDENGTPTAYLNIPYFTSFRDLNQEISNFLVTIINLNAFIFLIAGVIALFITNRITRSFSIIGDKMKEVNLGKLNEEITWNRDDEIGELVKEYNKMVQKLEESAYALAKSEREGAWREMARQVAHEIKNPLTPMKLSIQYLQKAVNNNQPNIKELTGSVANTLVEQIDHLSKIAADFSQFANIGNTRIEKFDLHDVIGSLKNLYRPNENVQFIWQALPGKLSVEADKTQMNRLFTNLFSNAVEACVVEETCIIRVTELRENGSIRISITDNGEGIAPLMQAKIFVPNFTTKSSGTGLGLAMCKSIVEQAHGRIWFETSEEKGTTFHVELPLAN